MDNKTKDEIIASAKKNDAIGFGEWLRTFDALTRTNGQWYLVSQISTEELYKHYQNWLNESK